MKVTLYLAAAILFVTGCISGLFMVVDKGLPYGVAFVGSMFLALIAANFAENA